MAAFVFIFGPIIVILLLAVVIGSHIDRKRKDK